MATTAAGVEEEKCAGLLETGHHTPRLTVWETLISREVTLNTVSCQLCEM